MSEFFNVTLDKDILLDDTAISLGMGWSSRKILNEILAQVSLLINDGVTNNINGWSGDKITQEILDYVKELINDNITNGLTTWSSEQILEQIVNSRITKFEELDDVDVINKEDKQIVVYSGDTHKFTTIDLEAMGEAAGLSLKQISKMGTVGSIATPNIVDIPMSTLDFKVPKVNVLKFQLGDQNVIKTENAFTNGESNDFNSDDMILFDGTAHLKNDFTYNMVQGLDIGSYKNYSVNLNNIFKSISNLSMVTNGDNSKTLDVTAMATDRLLIPKGDLNLSNVANIDYFSVTAASGAKLICSIDGGITWKTFNTDHWEDVNLTVSDVTTKGMTVAAFNAINSLYWNMLVTTNKIRFAYLLQDSNTIDQLTIQYDCPGYWMEAKNTEYDVIYASNSLLQVKLYISGDIKINY